MSCTDLPPFIMCIHTVPTTPMSDVCAVYDMNGTLEIIESTWNEMVRMFL